MSNYISASTITTPPNTVYDDYICDNGVTRPYKRVLDNIGNVLSETYRNTSGAWVAIPAIIPATMKYGECLIVPHTLQLTGQLLNASGNTVITHNLNLPAPFRVNVQAREPLPSGSEVSVKVVNYTANNFTIFSPLQTAVTVDLFITGKDI